MSRCELPPALPGSGEEPVFEAPWQAQAFAMTLALHQAGCFAWGEWAETLGAEIARGGKPYYEHWLDALERIVAVKGIASEAVLAARREAWARAAARTPHGAPIELAKGLA
ncbi:nitrile hydratase accessory protein [Pseudoroseomonas cervicalis]|uniref:nitrile hydratase accessory protein n=1 Tax=Teichococcus cervicalis TaxID=204525 RepID=UPI00278106ED|nr:nitrile hydratase accessory protein [Pseudoroseomonas cervicalis]MDQ1077661.1 nitrile hydratase accessory protein [Pseudoroseomonas cervicalis]